MQFGGDTSKMHRVRATGKAAARRRPAARRPGDGGLLRLPLPLTLCGVAPQAEAWLRERGVDFRPFAAEPAAGRELFLVGATPPAEEGFWRSLMERVDRGGAALFAAPAAFARGQDPVPQLALDGAQGPAVLQPQSPTVGLASSRPPTAHASRPARRDTPTGWRHHRLCLHPGGEGHLDRLLTGPLALDAPRHLGSRRLEVGRMMDGVLPAE